MTTPHVLSASTVTGDKVVNAQGEDLGKIEDIMIDTKDGHIGYAVLSFGGFLGIGDKFFAVPWEALSVDTDKHRMVLNVDKETLENAPGFDKNDWPDFADPEFKTTVYNHYGFRPRVYSE